MWCVDRSQGQCPKATWGVRMLSTQLLRRGFAALTLALITLPAAAQSFRVQCPTSTITHPTAANNNSEPAYVGPTYAGTSGYPAAPAHVNGAIKCQQISGGDGYSTMGDGTQTYMFSFGPLSGISDISNGLPGTEFPSVFNTVTTSLLQPGDPATTGTTYNGAVGLVPNLDALAAGSCTGPCLDGHVDPRQIMDVGVMNGNIPAPLMAIDEDDEFFLTLTNVGMIMRPDLFEQHTVPFHADPNASSFYDVDVSTAYDVEYPIQIHGFDPSFHFIGMTFNPEEFADMKDKFFLLNGRSYPDTVTPGPLKTQSADGVNHFSQPLPTIINIPAGKKALLRISDLDVTEYQTLASIGIPMNVIGINAKLLRDQAGNNLNYNTNSITLAGGESLDVILDATDTTKYPSGSVFYLYTPNLDHLSNDAENFGGLMTEVHIN